MKTLKILDRHLLNLAWSLWTELGVAGTIRNHKNTLIWVEELILFTSVLGELDPRLRDETLDWCAKFSHYISLDRLKSLTNDFKGLIEEPFSRFAATLKLLTKANWPLLIDVLPLQVLLSQKSVLRPCASAALLNIRARGMFSTGARADLITFFLMHPDTDFSIAETTEIGYSKRNLANILEDLHSVQLFIRFPQGNQFHYRLEKASPIFRVLQPIPKNGVSWRHIFKVLLSLRACLVRIENLSETTKAVEIINCLEKLDVPLKKLRLTPPKFANDFFHFINTFHQWLLEWVSLLASGE